MPRYLKRPVEIEARQWDGTAAGAIEIINWVLGEGGNATYHCENGEACRADHHDLKIATLEGSMLANPGDYIIKGVQGEFYPCKPGIFEQTYDTIEETA